MARIWRPQGGAKRDPSSCDVDNVASRRVIEANGGVLLRQCAPSWFAEAAYLLYEIPLI
ncbi:hypothetical protein [Methylocystis sp.]|uniref:hypothetical protein n=1 Tax=Methylocystis sp. TaxID=1911079 RepID=UPI003DA24A3A